MKRIIALLLFLLIFLLHSRHYFYHRMEEVTDVTQWRVTADNPPRGEELDYQRCAALHNHILELGWVGAGHYLADLDRRSWWEFHGPAAEAIRSRLVPSVINFLQRAQIGTADDSWHWHYYFSGLSYPDQLFAARNLDDNDDDVLLLYSLALSLSHPRGLV
jgi:hypothetical protein